MSLFPQRKKEELLVARPKTKKRTENEAESIAHQRRSTREQRTKPTNEEEVARSARGQHAAANHYGDDRTIQTKHLLLFTGDSQG
jgi:hypothetical protein